jgi:hypothetical protein
MIWSGSFFVIIHHFSKGAESLEWHTLAHIVSRSARFSNATMSPELLKSAPVTDGRNKTGRKEGANEKIFEAGSCYDSCTGNHGSGCGTGAGGWRTDPDAVGYDGLALLSSQKQQRDEYGMPIHGA